VVPVLSQMNPFHTCPYFSPTIHSSIILPSVPRSSEWSLHLCFLTKILYASLISPVRATCPAHLIIPHLITPVISVEVNKTLKLIIMLSSSASCPFLLLKCKYSLQHRVLKHHQSTLFHYCERSSFTLNTKQRLK
jgi:hypothetical protein